MNKRILIYSPFSLAYGGGGERWAIEVFTRLKSSYIVRTVTADFIGGAGREKVVIDEEREAELRDRLNWTTIPSRWIPPGILLLTPKALLQLRKEIEASDIVFFNNIPIQDILIQLTSISLSTPIVSVFQSPPSGHTRLTRAYENRVLPKVAPRFEAQYVLNDYTEQLLSDIGCKKIVKLPNGVDTDHFSPAARTVPSGEFRVLFVGNLSEQKGADLLEDIIRRILSENGRINFTIVGQGVMERDIERLSKEYPDRVTYAGQVPHEDLASIYANHELLLLPSRMEGLPLVGAEAQATGTPIIASDAQGAREVLMNEKSGFVVPLTVEDFVEKIRDVYALWTENHESYLSLRDQSRKHAEQKFDWDHITREVEKLIQEITEAQ